MENHSPHVLVVGAGFGGLTFCQEFNFPPARVTLVDKHNHHLFQPLLYQVATAGLAAPDIAQPIRSILAHKPNVTVLLDEAREFNLDQREVVFTKSRLSYDYLVLAVGGITSYFGHPEWEQFAPGLKSLRDAIQIRNHVLLAFEKAETEAETAAREALMTIVVVGGGPTGVELAGAFAELARFVLTRDFRRIDPSKARVILIEASHVILNHLPAELAASAQSQLQHLGVEVRTSSRVKAIRRGIVELEDGSSIAAETVVWAAGVSAHPLTRKLGVDLDRAGRVKVNPDLSLPGRPEVFAIGDMAAVFDKKGNQVPGVSPAAIQMAQHCAQIIQDELSESPATRPPRRPFAYWDKGTMATIGRSAAVAKIGQFEFSGFPAWLAWLGVHLIFLLGFRNKIAVLIDWAYSYFTYKRGARIVTYHEP